MVGLFLLGYATIPAIVVAWGFVELWAKSYDLPSSQRLAKAVEMVTFCWLPTPFFVSRSESRRCRVRFRFWLGRPSFRFRRRDLEHSQPRLASRIRCLSSGSPSRKRAAASWHSTRPGGVGSVVHRARQHGGVARALSRTTSPLHRGAALLLQLLRVQAESCPRAV